MTKIKKHISIPSDIDIMILDYARKCNISFSEAVVQLVSSGINNQEIDIKVKTLRNELNNNPIWYWDKNVIDKVINIDSLKYNNPWKDRLRGDWFNVILSQDKETRFKYIFKWINTKENMYKN